MAKARARARSRPLVTKAEIIPASGSPDMKVIGYLFWCAGQEL